MKVPLYAGHKIPGSIPPEQVYPHAGLWFERFFNAYDTDWAINAVKDKWIKTVTGKQGNPQQLASYQQRQQALVSRLNGQSHLYNTDWYFVSGMGNPHPVENGFSWHPTLAVPYLAGSAVKGLVRAWVELNDEEELSKDANNARLKHWFGTTDKKDVPEQSGAFIFFDAIPNNQPILTCDIMTPHMGDWYQKGETGSTKPSDIPADWHEPTPIPFLAVKNASFIFSIAPRRDDDTNQLEQVFSALENALAWLGAGAKTAAGYGYMTKEAGFYELYLAAEEKRIKDRQDEDKLTEQLKNCSPLATEYFNQAKEQNWLDDKERFLQSGVLETWLERLEQQDKVESEVLSSLVELINKYLQKGLLAEPDKMKKGTKKESYFYPKKRQREIAHRLNDLLAK